MKEIVYGKIEYRCMSAVKMDLPSLNGIQISSGVATWGFDRIPIYHICWDGYINYWTMTIKKDTPQGIKVSKLIEKKQYLKLETYIKNLYLKKISLLDLEEIIDRAAKKSRNKLRQEMLEMFNEEF